MFEQEIFLSTKALGTEAASRRPSERLMYDLQCDRHIISLTSMAGGQTLIHI